MSDIVALIDVLTLLNNEKDLSASQLPPPTRNIILVDDECWEIFLSLRKPRCLQLFQEHYFSLPQKIFQNYLVNPMTEYSILNASLIVLFMIN